MGYREHSYDPNVYEQPGRPLRPFNWVQWTGVALGTVGAVLITLDLLGKLGWIPRWTGDLSPGPFIALIMGSVLVNSRREPGNLITEEQRARNKRTLLITTVICAVVLGAALVIEFAGASR